MRDLNVPLEMLEVVKYRDEQGRDDKNIALLARGDWEDAMHLLIYVLSLSSKGYLEVLASRRSESEPSQM